MHLPDDVRALAHLFAEALPEVRFPDIDAEVLRAGVTRADALAAEVERLEAELATARGALQAACDDVARAASRAQAYARVYADGDEALRARLDALDLRRGGSAKPKGPVAAPVKRRKRSAPAPEALFGEAPSEPEVQAEAS